MKKKFSLNKQHDTNAEYLQLYFATCNSIGLHSRRTSYLLIVTIVKTDRHFNRILRPQLAGPHVQGHAPYTVKRGLDLNLYINRGLESRSQISKMRRHTSVKRRWSKIPGRKRGPFDRKTIKSKSIAESFTNTETHNTAWYWTWVSYSLYSRGYNTQATFIRQLSEQENYLPVLSINPASGKPNWSHPYFN